MWDEVACGSLEELSVNECYPWTILHITSAK